jgi:protein-L-isoaspartate(D-aspartate) O-methyltransferase
MLDQATKRRAMVDNQLRTYDITQQSVLAAMEQVEREDFVPAKVQPIAYADRVVAFEGSDRFMLSPMLLGKLLQSAQIGPEDRILDVGCGSGYSTLVLSHLSHHVSAIEQEPVLVEQTRKALKAAHLNHIAVFREHLSGDGHKHGPYDVIVVQGGIAVQPDHLLDLLADGGRLVAVDLSDGAGQIVRYVKNAKGFGCVRVASAQAPLLAAFRKQSGFEF